MESFKFTFDDIDFTSYGRTTVYAPRVLCSRLNLCDRIHYIHKGKEFLCHNGVTHTLLPGNFYFFPHNLDFEFRYDDQGCDHSFIDFLPTPTIQCQSWMQFDEEKYPLLYSSLLLIFNYVHRFPQEDTTESLYYSKIIKNQMLCFLDIMNHNNIITPINNPTINLILDYIHNKFKDDISVKTLSQLVHMEENTFIRYFKRFTSYTPYSYIKLYRLNTAVTMLKQDISISEIADFLGYSSVANFSKAFNKHFGYYPSKVKNHYI